MVADLGVSLPCKAARYLAAPEDLLETALLLGSDAAVSRSESGEMVVLKDPPPTAEIEIERTTVTREALDRFVGSATLPATRRWISGVAPLSFALALRRDHGPGASISPRAFAIHGGHDIQDHSPIVVGETYVVSGSIERVFAKTGRSGILTIIERRVWIRDVRGPLAVEMTDRQIVRWRPDVDQPSTSRDGTSSGAHELTHQEEFASRGSEPPLDVGDPLEPLLHPGVSAPQISAWADALRDREVLFHDRSEARRLGYDDLVVPGPMQSAVVDCWLRQAAPAWRPRRIHMTFRQSLLAGQPLRIDAVVVDTEADRRTLDILIRNSGSGDTTAAGTVELQPLEFG